MYSRGTAAFWNKLKKEVILCLQIRQAVAGNIYKRKWHFNIIGLSRGMEKCSVDFIQEDNNMNKRTMKKGLAIVLALVMVFAMTATAFADTNDNITVTVKFDIRSYDLKSVVMKKNDNANFGTSPVVTLTNVSVPSGSTVQYVLEQVAAANNLELRSKVAPDIDSTKPDHTAFTSIAKVGEYYIDNSTNPSIKPAFLTTNVPTTVDPRGYYYESGWVYGLKTGTGDEYFPGSYMDSVEVTNGMTVTFHYSVTGCIDINTGTWTSDYSNPDVTMWNLYDKIAALDPNDSFGALSYTTGTITTGANVAQNTTGLTAYYFSHNGLTSEADEQLIPWLQAILASLEA